MRQQQQQTDPWIEVRADVQAGTPVVKGTRIPIQTVVKYLRAGYTPEQICDDLPTLTPEAIEAVRCYYEGKRKRPLHSHRQAKAA